jgi:hypothetical protein
MPGYPGVAVTTEEIGEIAASAALGPAEREQLSRSAADISLATGDYAAHEGDELASRALNQARRLGAEILVTRSITRIDAATRTSTTATSCARGCPLRPGEARRRRRRLAPDHPARNGHARLTGIRTCDLRFRS